MSHPNGNSSIDNEVDGEQPKSSHQAVLDASSSCSPDNSLEDYEKSLLLDEQSKFEKGHKYFKSLLIEELRKINLNNKNNSPRTRLFSYQIEAVLAVDEAFNTVPNNAEFPKLLIVAPPGSGKSGMVTLIPYILASKKVLILTPSKIISEQLAAEFGYLMRAKSKIPPFFQKVGIFLEETRLKNALEKVHLANNQKDMENIEEYNLVIVNAQKFGGKSGSSLSSVRTPEERDKVAKQLDHFDTIIVDEAHHYPASTWENVVNVFSGKKVVFLTATPFRGLMYNETTLGPLSTLKKVYEISTEKLEGTTIRRMRFIDCPAESKILLGPVFLDQLKKEVNDNLSVHMEQEVRSRENGQRPQAMILVRTKNEAEGVARGLGVEATFITSDKPGTQNLTEFTQGKKKIAVVCGMLREGYDNPNVTLVVVLRNCQSRVLFEQFCGRCMRMRRDLTGKHPDKTVGTVLSFQHFEQGKMWAARLEMAEKDPEEEEEEEEEENGKN